MRTEKKLCRLKAILRQSFLDYICKSMFKGVQDGADITKKDLKSFRNHLTST